MKRMLMLLLVLLCLCVGATALAEEKERETVALGARGQLVVRIQQRLMDLGFVPGSEVRPLFAAPLGDPRAYLVCDTVIALRQKDAATVAVEGL